jgi:hypothetical protein
MTQAFNLSQLANRVNTSGQLDAATGLFNQTPVANGGTGRSSVTAGRLLVGAGTGAMTLLAGTTVGDAVTWNGTAWVSGTVGGAMPQIERFVAPGTWTKPASIKGIKVTVVGAGGSSGSSPSASAGMGGGGGGGAVIEYIAAPSIPGPVAVTAGPGTNSFGSFCSATAGAAGSGSAAGSAGAGSGGNVNIEGGAGNASGPSGGNNPGGAGGGSILGGGGRGGVWPPPGTPFSAGQSGGNYGGGGGGASSSPSAFAKPATTGAPGIVIVEEFY